VQDSELHKNWPLTAISCAKPLEARLRRTRLHTTKARQTSHKSPEPKDAIIVGSSSSCASTNDTGSFCTVHLCRHGCTAS
jgi:hypothetical protein